MRFMRIRVSLPCFLLAISGPAHAVDGVLEINQACAVNAGCFAGDTAGFPVTITGAGSGGVNLGDNYCAGNNVVLDTCP